MTFAILKSKSAYKNNEELQQKFAEFKKLIAAMKKKKIPAEHIEEINAEIGLINNFDGDDSALLKQYKNSLAGVISMLESKLSLTPKGYYRNKWMAIGIALFGVVFGTILGTALDNMAFIALGIPLGVGLGLAIGRVKDKKAFEKGNQLDIEIGK